MSKKAIIGSLLVAGMLAANINGNFYMLKQKELEGSAIYIPKRHKFKRRNKR